MSKDPFSFDDVDFTNEWSSGEESAPALPVQHETATPRTVSKPVLVAAAAVALLAVGVLGGMLISGRAAAPSVGAVVSPTASTSNSSQSSAAEVLPTEAPSPNATWNTAADVTVKEEKFLAALRKQALPELRLFAESSLVELGHSMCDGKKGKLKDWEIVKEFVRQWEITYPNFGNPEPLARLLLGQAKKHLC